MRLMSVTKTPTWLNVSVNDIKIAPPLALYPRTLQPSACSIAESLFHRPGDNHRSPCISRSFAPHHIIIHRVQLARLAAALAVADGLARSIVSGGISPTTTLPYGK